MTRGSSQRAKIVTAFCVNNFIRHTTRNLLPLCWHFFFLRLTGADALRLNIERCWLVSRVEGMATHTCTHTSALLSLLSEKTKWQQWPCSHHVLLNIPYPILKHSFPLPRGITSATSEFFVYTKFGKIKTSVHFALRVDIAISSVA